MKKIFGFTLAEILITLGIIGVVAVLTIPTIITRIQERVWISQFNKVTASIQNAYKLIYEDYGPTSNWDLKDVYYDESSIDKVVSLFSMYIPQMSNKIQVRDISRYIPHNLQGSKESSVQYQKYFKGYYLMDGSVVFITIVSSAVDLGPAANGPFVQMTIDINGLKTGPNVIGKDIFLIYLGRNKPILTGYPLWWVNKGHCSVKNPSGGWTSGGACANWVLKMRNMDYLHRDLSAEEWSRVMQWNDK